MLDPLVTILLMSSINHAMSGGSSASVVVMEASFSEGKAVLCSTVVSSELSVV